MKRLLFLLLFTAPAFAQSGQPVAVPIQNASFEQLPIQDPAYQLPNAVMQTNRCYNYFFARSGYPNELPPGWHQSLSGPGGYAVGTVTIFQPLAPYACNIPQPPDGSWILNLSGATLSQDTGVKPSDLQRPGVGAATGKYLMSFWVANHVTVYPGYYEAKITFGHIDPITQTVVGHELCSIDGWATQHFEEITWPCLAPDYLLGQWPDGSAIDPDAHIVISLGFGDQKGWDLLFDKISVTFTPLS